VFKKNKSIVDLVIRLWVVLLHAIDNCFRKLGVFSVSQGDVQKVVSDVRVTPVNDLTKRSKFVLSIRPDWKFIISNDCWCGSGSPDL